MAIRETLSIRILQTLTNRGLNHRKIAAIVGVHPSEISKIKAGQREWTTEQLKILAKYMRMRLGLLLLIALDGIEDDQELDRQFDGLLKSLISEAA